MEVVRKYVKTKVIHATNTQFQRANAYFLLVIIGLLVDNVLNPKWTINCVADVHSKQTTVVDGAGSSCGKVCQREQTKIADF